MNAKEFLLAIAEWLCRNIKVPKDQVITVLNMMDADADGNISLGEIIGFIRGML